MATKSKRKSVSRAKPQDAVALLKADHRQVAEWFSEFEKARTASRREHLSANICSALRVHTTIEEEIFYPAFLEATGNLSLHHEAVVEHDGAKKLIAEIEQMSPSDDYFVAKMTVLSEMIKHHVREEEQAGGMFSQAKKADMDLVAIGEDLARRKNELQGRLRAA